MWALGEVPASETFRSQLKAIPLKDWLEIIGVLLIPLLVLGATLIYSEIRDLIVRRREVKELTDILHIELCQVAHRLITIIISVNGAIKHRPPADLLQLTLQAQRMRPAIFEANAHRLMLLSPRRASKLVLFYAACEVAFTGTAAHLSSLRRTPTTPEGLEQLAAAYERLRVIWARACGNAASTLAEFPDALRLPFERVQLTSESLRRKLEGIAAKYAAPPQQQA